MYYYIHILRRLSFIKVLNFIKLLLSYHISRLIHKPLVWGRPFSISVEPTTSCNLRCPQCPSGLRSFSRDIGMLEPELFNGILEQLKKYVHNIVFYFQGEPFLNPKFLEMVKLAEQKGIYTITSTNAHYITEDLAKKTVLSGLSKLIISVDGADQESYEKYRVGGDLTKVLQGTKHLVQQKKALNLKTPTVVWQFIVFKHNENQINQIKSLAKEYGVDKIQIKTAQIYDYENGSELIPENAEFSRYKRTENGNYQIKNKLLNQCWRMWQGCVITWNGLVVPCCFDKDAKHQMGDMQKESFQNIWFSDKYTRFRAKILKGRSEIDICTNCTEGTKVWSDD
ncbi:MAG: SPASM domain-containing protein [Sphingobacteriaceae bacterium]|nr:SPASM domain-containing protein [Sphingobacteriaceae bacterium]